MPIDLPDAVLAHAARSPERTDFVARLPRLLDELITEWELVVDPDGAPVASGRTAVVVPVRDPRGRAAALKVGWPHWEAEHEHLALRHWHAEGAVELLGADPRRFALLLERLDPTDLSEAWDVEACEVVAGLYPLLHLPAPPQLRRLSSCVAAWTDRLAGLPRSAPLPHRLVEQAVSLGRGLVADPATDGRLVHTDLHYENVLTGTRHDRPAWLAIDPKPLSGDPHYEVAPLLWNRWEELGDGYRGIRDGVRLRFHTVVDAAGLDEDRARAWVVVRVMHNALWELEDAEAARRRPDEDYLTTQVTAAKAVQD